MKIGGRRRPRLRESVPDAGRSGGRVHVGVPMSGLWFVVERGRAGGPAGSVPAVPDGVYGRGARGGGGSAGTGSGFGIGAGFGARPTSAGRGAGAASTEC